jgi:ribonuclease P protein component
MRRFAHLRRSSEIAFVRRRGRKTAFPTLAVFTAEDREGPPRIAITVGKPVGCAVERNLVRRRIRGALEEIGSALPGGRRFVFVARPGALAQPYAELAADVRRAVERAGS